MALTPTYDLDTIKSAFVGVSGLKMTGSARRDAYALGFSDRDIIDAIQALTPSDFYKTMQPYTSGYTAMHDVYKSMFRGHRLYIKFQMLASGQLLLSFKER